MPPPAPRELNKWLMIAMLAMIGTGLFASLRARRHRDGDPTALTPITEAPSVAAGSSADTGTDGG